MADERFDDSVAQNVEWGTEVMKLHFDSAGFQKAFKEASPGSPTRSSTPR